MIVMNAQSIDRLGMSQPFFRIRCHPSAAFRRSSAGGAQ
jgi:hypothetical protein